MWLVDVDIVVVLLVVVYPGAFAAFGPEEVGKCKILLVFLEDVAIILVILFEEKREVILCS